MLNGVLPVYKETDFTSYDVIKYIKKILPSKNEKMGHAGTLDPFAEGVLPIMIGNATKAFSFFLDSDKSYIAEIKFGAFTDTDDRTGNIIEKFEKWPLLKDIEEALIDFKGKIKQLPPLYSALRVNGKRAYELARQSKDFSLKEREVFIYNIELLDYKEDSVKVKVECSSGTYIRSIARDLGKKLGCGGYLYSLLRTKAANIELKDCVKLKDLNVKNISSFIIPVGKLINYPSIEWDKDESLIKNGIELKEDAIGIKLLDGKYKIVKNDELLAIVEKKGIKFKYLRVFI